MSNTTYFTREADDQHTYGMVYRAFAGNLKEHTVWFETPDDGKRFASRNAIVPLRFVRKDDAR